VRVLLVSAYFRPHVGGAERFTEMLAHGLGERGHDVTVLCCRTDRSAPATEAGSYRVRRLPATNAVEQRLGVPYPVPEPRALRRALREEIARADIVHVQDVLYATSAAALGLSGSTPTLVTLHVGFVPQRNALLDAAERAALLALGPLVRRATRVVSMSSAVAAWARDAWDVDVSLAPTGVEPAAGVPDRAAFGLPEGRLVALFVGRDVPKKGLDAFAGVSAPGWHLAAVTNGTRPGLRTIPFMRHDRFASLLASVDALVLPSTGEGVPLVLQEALAAGVRGAATFEPGYERYLAVDDIVPIDPEPGSIAAALEVLRDEATRQRYAERGRAVAARSFSAAAVVAAYESLYDGMSNPQVEG
jgi:glycosyltransferase involved in cell wall biosynthesis